MSQYSYFGDANPLTPDIVDPVEQCVGNTFFTKTGISGGYMQQDFCPRFMAQRCSTKWDDYCEAFLSSSNYDMGGYTHTNKNFLEETARKKYCRLNREAPGAQCAKKCEALIPEGQNSVTICENIGTQNYLDTKKEYDLAGNFPQTAKLTPVSPLYMDKCPEICDAKESTNTDALSADDTVLNKCIENGACNNILADLAYNAVKNNIDIKNPAFKKLIEYSKLNVPINANDAIKIAKSYGIPASVALEVLKTAKYSKSDMGNPVLVSGDKESILEASPEELNNIKKDESVINNIQNDLSVINNIQKEFENKEGFYDSNLKADVNPTNSPVTTSKPGVTNSPVVTSKPDHKHLPEHREKNKDILVYLVYTLLIGFLIYLLLSRK